MKLSRLLVIITLPLVAAGAAVAIDTVPLPERARYDSLISIDPGGMPIVPDALHVNAGVGYWMANKVYDKDGDSEDFKSEPNALVVPLDVGYAFDEHYMADITFEILRRSETWKPDTPEEKTVNAMGIGDIWVKARGLWETAADFYLGPRLSVKIPVGKANDDDEKPALGYRHVAIDAAGVVGKYGESTMFKMSGQVGFRYNMERTGYPLTVEYPDPANPNQTKTYTQDVDVTPGIMIYVHAEPGIGTWPTPERGFEIYLPIGYAMAMEDDITYPADWPADVPAKETPISSCLYVGLYPKYRLDERNAIGLKFLYPLMGKDTAQDIYFTLTYGAFIKL